jgi:hypothetical protein
MLTHSGGQGEEKDVFPEAGGAQGLLKGASVECAMPRFSRFHVLYSSAAIPSRRFRQIVSGASDDGTFYEVRIFEGEMVQMDPDFNAVGNGAEYYTHPTQEAADKDADEERDRSLATGWLVYDVNGR